MGINFKIYLYYFLVFMIKSDNLINIYKVTYQNIS